ncbi:MAG: carbohydrate-binding domain-containing protein [Muribaculaceae bacterium]|nr:carbohydrate-binding domain-containing protein [Muribaculaceae bacterium]
MKPQYILLGVLSASLLCHAPAHAQTLNVNCGNVSYHFDSSQTGVMNYSNGSELTILGKTFEIEDIKSITTVDQSIADNTVKVEYGNSSASVTIAGNIAQYVDAEIEGGHVSIEQSKDVSDTTCGEITYILSGECSDGEFTLEGSYKASIELDGLTLTNPNGAAIDIENGKRIAVRVKENTVNTLTDGAAGSQKAALYCKGHLEFKQKGTLNVIGNKGHAISAKEYIEIKNAKINVISAKKDGISCNQYFLMESGDLQISGTGDDGIQVEYKDDTDREAEDTGSITIKGGTININVTADAAKALKADGDFIMTKGDLTATVNGGGIWDSDKKKTKASSCIGIDGNLNISGGTLNLTATNGGGKGISVDGNCQISGGTFNISTSGGMMAYVNGSVNNNYTGNADRLSSDYKSSPKGIKVDGTIVIDDGDITIETKGNGGEGLESKKTLTINGGKINIRAYEDGTNSSSHTYINGGEIEVTTGTGDAIDSNGNIYIAGGKVTVIGASSPEQGLDAGDGYTVYITGGNILAAGGGNSAPSNSNSTQAYVVLTQNVEAGANVTVKDGENVLAIFTIPAKYGNNTATRGPGGPGGSGGGGWDWGWGGSGGSSLLISTPEMVSGKTYTITSGSNSTTATARTTGGSSGPGGGH